MGKGKLLVLFFSLIIITNCTTFQTIQVLEEEYQSPVKDYNTSLTLLPLTEEYVDEEVMKNYLSNPENTPSLISRTNRDIYKNYFGLTFSETITGEVTDLVGTQDLGFDEIVFKDTSLVLNKNISIDVLVPESGKLISADKPTNFSLLTQSIIWETGYVEEQSKPIGGNTVQRIEFTLRLKYVLWDNYKEQIAGYGQIHERRNLTALPDRIFYIQLFEDVSRLIIRESPLQERYR